MPSSETVADSSAAMWCLKMNGSLVARLLRTVIHFRRSVVHSRSAEFAILDDGEGRKVFAKIYASDSKMEYLRGLAIYEAGVRSGLFRAPRPLVLVESQQVIIWEYIDCLTGSRQFLTRHVRQQPADIRLRLGMVRRIGESLAAIHDGLNSLGIERQDCHIPLHNSGNIQLDRHVGSQIKKLDQRPLHWDFSWGNIFFIEKISEPPSVVILDSTPNSYLRPPGGTQMLSPVYIDGAQLIFSLWCHPEFFAPVRSELDCYLEEFIAGYAAISGAILDQATLLACAAEIAKVYQAYADGCQNNISVRHWRSKRFRLKRADDLVHAAVRSMAEN